MLMVSAVFAGRRSPAPVDQAGNVSRCSNISMPRGLGGKVGGFFGDHAWILRDAQGPF